VMLRGFRNTEPDLCQRLITLLGGSLMENVFWSTPRSRVADKTFTATEYPAREEIAPHSEMAYMPTYPRLLCFHALKSAETGGQTTVADIDAVSADLGGITDEFLRRSVRYVRVFREGLDVPLSAAVGTDDPQQIARIAQEYGMTIEAVGDGVTRLSHIARGALADAEDGHPIWFNQMLLYHPARLPASVRRNLIDLLGADGLPRQVCFADGGAIPETTVDAVARAFNRHAQSITWQASDVVLVDNTRYAHGRRPFTGQRAVHVALGFPQSGEHRTSLDAVRVPAHR
jgi:hypothetical protein